ncbi:Palmitoyltransferase zdhhc23, partial [Biomphalaria glabrata]
TAICFVTAVYCILVSSFMLVGLLYQFVLISQNVTSHELAHGQRRGQTRCCFFLKDNPHSRGFLRNWLEFWFMGSRVSNLSSVS